MAEKNQKLKVIKTVTTVNGTLYEGEVVMYDSPENGKFRVKDSMGRIWFVDKNNLANVK